MPHPPTDTHTYTCVHACKPKIIQIERYMTVKITQEWHFVCVCVCVCLCVIVEDRTWKIMCTHTRPKSWLVYVWACLCAIVCNVCVCVCVQIRVEALFSQSSEHCGTAHTNTTHTHTHTHSCLHSKAIFHSYDISQCCYTSSAQYIFTPLFQMKLFTYYNISCVNITVI